MLEERSLHPDQRPESSAIHTLRTTALVELILGWVIIFISSLLLLHDAFDFFTDIPIKTANWYLAVTANLLWLAIGLLILARRLTLHKALLLLLSIFAFCGIAELALMSGSPKADTETIEVSESAASLTDFLELSAEPASHRILVLGDERLGLLEAELQELVSGGSDLVIRARPWWSTADQRAFLEDFAPEETFDLTILVWNHDDPDIDGIRFVKLTWQDARRFAPAHLLFPRTWDFFTGHLNRFLESHVLSGYGEENWYRRLYDSDNLKGYAVVVRRFAELVRQRKMPTIVVVLPAEGKPDGRLDRALTHFDDAGLDIFDPRNRPLEALVPVLRERLPRGDEQR